MTPAEQQRLDRAIREARRKARLAKLAADRARDVALAMAEQRRGEVRT
jgi:hypothetical protein